MTHKHLVATQSSHSTISTSNGLTLPMHLVNDSHGAKLPGVFGIAPDFKAEVLEFLALRPLHTVVLTGLLLENKGGESRHGRFFVHRSSSGKLEGVALLGR